MSKCLTTFVNEFYDGFEMKDKEVKFWIKKKTCKQIVLIQTLGMCKSDVSFRFN